MSHDGQGLDKGLQPFRGKPLAQHAIERLAPQVHTLLVNANQHEDDYRAFGWPVVRDKLDGFAGPLAGLACALEVVVTPWVVTVPCDSPFFPLDLVERLADAADRTGSKVAVVHTLGQAQPVFLLANTALAGHLQAYLSGGGRKIDRWYASLAPAIVEFSDESLFRNINTRDDLSALE